MKFSSKVVKSALVLSATMMCLHSAQAINVPSDFNVSIVANGFGNISGITVDPSGKLFVSDLAGPHGPALMQVATDGSVTEVILPGVILGSPGRLTIGDGRAPLGTDLIMADWNTNVTSSCCNGSVFKINPFTGVWSVLSTGSPGVSTGDGFGIALGNGTAAAASSPGSLYVMDFQGASSDIPLLYKLDHTGARSRVLDAPGQWTTKQSPRDIVFGNGSAFGADLYVADPYTGNPQIWRVSDDGKITSLIKPGKILSPTSIRFGPSGLFGDNLFILDVTSHKLFIADAWGNVKIFADEIYGTSFSDMVFSADGRTLYLGLEDTIYAINVNKCS